GMRFVLGHGVGVGDQYVQSVAAGLAVRIGDADNEAIQYRVITSGVILCAIDGVAIVDLAGDCIVAGKGECALGSGQHYWVRTQIIQFGCGDGASADLQAGNAGLGGDGHLPGDGSGSIFGDADVADCHTIVIRYIHHRRAVSTAVDGYGDVGIGHIPIGIPHLVTEGLGQPLTVIQSVDCGVGVVQHIGVGAIGIGGKAAVLAGGGAAPAIESDRAVEGCVVGEGVAADAVAPTVLGQGMRFVLGHGVGVGDQHVQGVAAGLVQAVSHDNVE